MSLETSGALWDPPYTGQKETRAPLFFLQTRPVQICFCTRPRRLTQTPSEPTNIQVNAHPVDRNLYSWEPICHRSPEHLKMSLFKPKILGEPRTPRNEPDETIWEPMYHPSPEHITMTLLSSSGKHFATRAQNTSF